MEIKVTTNQILKILQLFSWIIFIGLCIDAAALIINAFIALFINPVRVENFWNGSVYLADLLKADRGYFVVIVSTMIIVAVLKAIMFYLIVKLFVEKKLNILQPFSKDLGRFILHIAYLSLGIALFSHSGYNYTRWLMHRGHASVDTRSLNIAGADVWLFMAVILFVIVHIVKRGMELQRENDLTI